MFSMAELSKIADWGNEVAKQKNIRLKTLYYNNN